MKTQIIISSVLGLTILGHAENKMVPAAPKEKAKVVAAATPPEKIPGLEYKVLKKGKGDKIKNGQEATVHYTGWLTNGTKFDSSKDHGQPFKFKVGGGNVIKGWDLGVHNMQVGETRKLTIKPELGYGPGGSGPIPPNSTLVFDVELLAMAGTPDPANP